MPGDLNGADKNIRNSDFELSTPTGYKKLQKNAKRNLLSNVTNWVTGQRSRQFGMAGHVIRKKDGR